MISMHVTPYTVVEGRTSTSRRILYPISLDKPSGECV